SFIK
ncbi:hypothetical protein CISIN_1g0339362mg, partial [Citrus sinensis]